MPNVSNSDVEDAYFTWWHFVMDDCGGKLPSKATDRAGRNERSRFAYEQFFIFIEQDLIWDKWPDWFHLSEKAASRITMLRGPHHKALLQAYIIQHELPWKCSEK